MAPSVSNEARTVLAKKTNLRIVTLPWPSAASGGIEWRQLFGGWLLQAPDAGVAASEPMTVVTKRAPTQREQADVRFAWIAAKHVTSNGIVLARECATVGIGQGQPSRVGSVRLAIRKAGERARGAVAASDGFFPFPDSVELLAAAGVTAVIQPGGSIRDAEVVAAADRLTIAMTVTGTRHFRH
jgi:phosphoribosylaminoimidazolecarboxamide formyltransferase/IMP cyclohydrolase